MAMNFRRESSHLHQFICGSKKNTRGLGAMGNGDVDVAASSKMLAIATSATTR